ncbi:MAG: 50S ribosomal protein L13 [Candidatus Shikimatogenerans bostrichidophilus]|nr:MAG: 50S ribosomal protein L13 [Candidatus Shikimatogenerans bostrichidophilus]
MIYFNIKTKYFINLSKKKYLIDAKNKKIGRLSSKVVNLLLGKNNYKYTPNYSFINQIYIINAKFLLLSKNKLKKKIYYRYSGYIGNKKIYTLETLFKKNPTIILKRSIFRMLPKNLLGKYAKKNLFIYNENLINKNKLIKYKI